MILENNVVSQHITLLRTPVVSSLHSFSAPKTPPIALAYLAAALIDQGFDVTPIDALGEAIDQVRLYENPECQVRGLSIEEIIERIPEKTGVIAVSCMFSQEWLFVRKIIENIKIAYPDIPIVIGGEHATAAPEHILETCPEVELCALGEGEETIVDIAKYFPQSPKKISGVVYRRDGQICRTQPRIRIRDVSEIPRPAWHLFPLEPYLERKYGQGISAGRCIPILATRGCPFECTFCSNKKMWTQRYYTRNPQDVIDEIEGYVKSYNVDHIEFFDSTAIVKKDWVLAFGRLLQERNLKIIWSLPSGTRSEALDEQVTALLAKTNCRYLVYAAESGSPDMLKYIKKKVQLDKMITSMKSAKTNGLNLRCNLMLGLPKEKRKDVWKTLFFQIKLAFVGVDDAPLYMFSPYPGTAIYEYLREAGRIPKMDDNYYRSLLCQMDLTETSSYCENISPKELGFYRLLGMCVFYGLSYILRPKRIWRSIRNIAFTQKTETVFEQRIVEMLRTRQQIKLGSQLPSPESSS